MKVLGNIIWFFFGGLELCLVWLIVGVIWCITIVGIPVGIQCFKFAKLALFPFGKDIIYDNGLASVLINIVWIIFGGLVLALGNYIVGIIYCATIIGIPFGIQCFKMGKLSLMPFGASIVAN